MRRAQRISAGSFPTALCAMMRATAWTVSHTDAFRAIEAEFARVAFLYIADGHHRCAAAARVYQKRSAAVSGRDAFHLVPNSLNPAAFFLSVIFPHNQVRILPY